MITIIVEGNVVADVVSDDPALIGKTVRIIDYNIDHADRRRSTSSRMLAATTSRYCGRKPSPAPPSANRFQCSRRRARLFQNAFPMPGKSSSPTPSRSRRMPATPRSKRKSAGRRTTIDKGSSNSRSIARPRRHCGALPYRCLARVGTHPAFRYS